MQDFWKLALENLLAALVGFSIFGMAYLSNVSFSLYYNIKIAGETFEKQRLINSLYKILAFAGGTMLLVLSTSLIILGQIKTIFLFLLNIVLLFQQWQLWECVYLVL